MNIVDRLNSFLEMSGITKSQFADNCEIPRPTASQILSGRNKKISDDIISKIHKIYPSLSISWLLFGEGDMLMPNSEYAPSKPSEIPIFCDSLGDKPEFLKENEINCNELIRNSNINKQITKIVVFYSDNSFEEFYKIKE